MSSLLNCAPSKYIPIKMLFNFQDVNDDLADMLEQADEVQEALGRQYGMPEIDDDELAAELDALGMHFYTVNLTLTTLWHMFCLTYNDYSMGGLI